MAENKISKPLAFVLVTAMSASLAGAGVAEAGNNPFSMTSLPGGNLLLAEARCDSKMVAEGHGGGCKCDMRKMDADGDGRVTREEFMQGHAEIFSVVDANGDGVIDADEYATHRDGG